MQISTSGARPTASPLNMVQSSAVTNLTEAFAKGATKVRIRIPTGMGGLASCLSYFGAVATEGRCLALFPPALTAQAFDVCGRLNIVAGEPGSSSQIEIQSYMRALKMPEAETTSYDWLLLDEVQSPMRGRARTLVERFGNARVIELLRMPAPYRGILNDADVDLSFVLQPLAA